MAAVSACVDKNPVLTVEGGKIKGVLTDSTNVMVYKGIPYAAPPVGNLKLKPPQPVVPWRGVKIADTFSKICPQAGSPPGTFCGTNSLERDPGSERTVSISILSAGGIDQFSGCKLPVAMWIHGRAFIGGYGREVTMDGMPGQQRALFL